MFYGVNGFNFTVQNAEKFDTPRFREDPTNFFNTCEKCHFRYLEESNEITLSLTEAEFNRDDSEGPYDWTYLGAEGKGIELSFPEDFSTKIDVRFSKDGVETNPLRFRIKPIDGDILYQGQSVGDYQKGELCSGSFQDFCRVVRTEDKFLITFKSKKG